MKRIVIGMTAAMSLFATGALAADMAARPYVKAPPPIVAVYNWTGFYIGGNVGYSQGRSRDDSTGSGKNIRTSEGYLSAGKAASFGLKRDAVRSTPNLPYDHLVMNISKAEHSS